MKHGKILVSSCPIFDLKTGDKDHKIKLMRWLSGLKAFAAKPDD